jgi:cell division protein FtsX
MCCGAGAAAIAISFGVVNGHHSVPTDVAGLTGSECSVDDRWLHTKFPLIYNVVLVLVFIGCFVAMIVSYAQIAHKLMRHKRKSLNGGMIAELAHAFE